MLHDLDIMRKHKRLLLVSLFPVRFSVVGIKPEDFTIPGIHVGANGETLLAILSPGVTAGQLNLSFFVALNETGEYGTMPVQLAIKRFAWIAGDVIRAFDKV